MDVLGVITALAICYMSVSEVYTNTLMCLECTNVRDPSQCHTTRKCSMPKQECAMEVHEYSGEYRFSMGCRLTEDCRRYSLFGKRGGHLLPYVGYLLKCDKCCTGDLCNKNLCGGFQGLSVTTSTASQNGQITSASPISTTAVPLATTPVVTAAQVIDPNCVDHEEDGFSCKALDLFNICTDLDTFVYVVAHKKCPRHCGFCTGGPVTPALTVHPPHSSICQNYEHDGLTCAHLDLFDVCNATSPITHTFAYLKCAKHCGLCVANTGTGPVTNAPITQTTVKQTTTTMMIFSATAGTIPSTTSTTNVAKTTPSPTPHSFIPCMDFEDSNFTCKAWAAQGFCAAVPGTAYETSKLRCRKFCGFC